MAAPPPPPKKPATPPPAPAKPAPVPVAAKPPTITIPTNNPTPPVAVPNPAPSSTSTQSGPSPQTSPGKGMTWAETINSWVQAGGNPQAAQMAAAVADASSGLNPSATNNNGDGTSSKGLWMINSNYGALASLDPLSNAHAAVQQSNNGTDWSQWCSTWSDNACGANGGTYLGEGSNALAALKLQGGAYSVAGAAAAGTGGSATTPAAAPSPSASSGSGLLSGMKSSGGMSGYMIYIIIGLIVFGAVWFSMHKGKGKTPAPPEATP